jgi:hypothetical protein
MSLNEIVGKLVEFEVHMFEFASVIFNRVRGNVYQVYVRRIYVITLNKIQLIPFVEEY